MVLEKRNVSVKEITPNENCGYLYYRNRRGLAVASWTKFFFVLQESNFYGFKCRESTKADLFIHLPGFTCTLAEEVKSKDYSFKIYHTGRFFHTNVKLNIDTRRRELINFFFKYFRYGFLFCGKFARGFTTVVGFDKRCHFESGWKRRRRSGSSTRRC